MGSEVERRVTDAFKALADTAGQIGDQPFAAGRPARNRRLPAIAAAAAVILAGGAFLLSGQPEPAPPSRPEVVPFTVTTTPPMQLAYDMYTHCGVDEAKIGDVFFEAETPIPGPPQDWGNPYQPGVVTLLSPSEAVFRDDRGHEVRLRARSGATAFKRICQ